MEKIIKIGLTSFIVFMIISFKNNTHFTILGNWNIETDSTFQGVGLNNHAVNYVGIPGDYFDFRNDGNVYIKESKTFDTLSYKLISDTSIIIKSFGVIQNGIPEISHITNLSAYHASIFAPIELTSGGKFGRTVRLYK